MYWFFSSKHNFVINNWFCFHQKYFTCLFLNYAFVLCIQYIFFYFFIQKISRAERIISIQFHSAIETWCSAIFKAKTVPLMASIWSFVRMWSTKAELLQLIRVGSVICIFRPCFSNSWTYFLAIPSLVEEASILKSPAMIKGNLVDNAVWKMSSNSFKMSRGDFPLGR